MTALIGVFGLSLCSFLLQKHAKVGSLFKASLYSLGCFATGVGGALTILAFLATPLNSQHIQQLTSALKVKNLEVSATCEPSPGFSTWQVQYTLVTKTSSTTKTTTYSGVGDVGCFLNTPSNDGLAALKMRIRQETPLLFKEVPNL